MAWICSPLIMMLALLWGSGGLVNPENATRITPNMHIAGVVLVLGLPGDYRTKPRAYLEILRLRPGRCYSWMSDSCKVDVYLDTDWRVDAVDVWKPWRTIEEGKGGKEKASGVDSVNGGPQ